jgi:hypothetical protein
MPDRTNFTCKSMSLTSFSIAGSHQRPPSSVGASSDDAAVNDATVIRADADGTVVGEETMEETLPVGDEEKDDADSTDFENQFPETKIVRKSEVLEVQQEAEAEEDIDTSPVLSAGPDLGQAVPADHEDDDHESEQYLASTQALLGSNVSEVVKPELGEDQTEEEDDSMNQAAPSGIPKVQPEAVVDINTSLVLSAGPDLGQAVPADHDDDDNEGEEYLASTQALIGFNMSEAVKPELGKDQTDEEVNSINQAAPAEIPNLPEAEVDISSSPVLSASPDLDQAEPADIEDGDINSEQNLASTQLPTRPMSPAVLKHELVHAEEKDNVTSQGVQGGIPDVQPETEVDITSSPVLSASPDLGQGEQSDNEEDDNNSEQNQASAEGQNVPAATKPELGKEHDDEEQSLIPKPEQAGLAEVPLHGDEPASSIVPETEESAQAEQSSKTKESGLEDVITEAGELESGETGGNSGIAPGPEIASPATAGPSPDKAVSGAEKPEASAPTPSQTPKRGCRSAVAKTGTEPRPEPEKPAADSNVRRSGRATRPSAKISDADFVADPFAFDAPISPTKRSEPKKSEVVDEPISEEQKPVEVPATVSPVKRRGRPSKASQESVKIDDVEVLASPVKRGRKETSKSPTKKPKAEKPTPEVEVKRVEVETEAAAVKSPAKRGRKPASATTDDKSAAKVAPKRGREAKQKPSSQPKDDATSNVVASTSTIPPSADVIDEVVPEKTKEEEPDHVSTS